VRHASTGNQRAPVTVAPRPDIAGHAALPVQRTAPPRRSATPLGSATVLVADPAHRTVENTCRLWVGVSGAGMAVKQRVMAAPNG
jgi:hypothetical protein